MMTKYPIGHIRRTVSCLVILFRCGTIILIQACTPPIPASKASTPSARGENTFYQHNIWWGFARSS